ncbi:hypothetical protein [Reichenbachiella ulvae]|uniref:Uncharacterized protein n=1 Tax=Reichenbachiella ulvae TaxID=2980104 RepID=A0ABT3CQG8_9BACT|nr:hypothetical protein [Reichenbachiella ulvae]MCV9385816.1 hypothetical protein [Reichenbachiella ulvae]
MIRFKPVLFPLCLVMFPFVSLAQILNINTLDVTTDYSDYFSGG